ncbi:hypothetical protein [Denitromonas iodatirespirans]|uniref:Uncharacterized protein n=1 Tax=Denitromonas iodatirespirans TaxID=2795389 RepID=A0A944D9E2_DENI1|nr:hypothetical protein [Denitromonas iodatirespirans]MBT0962399.1 hypothetical protein [Denitromonas iodatirespirans]
MFKWFSCCAADTASPSGIEPIERALQPGTTAVISVACCTPGAAGGDEEVLAAVAQGLKLLGDERVPLLVSATEAQKFAMGMPAHLDAPARRAVEQVVALFSQHGMGIFPVVMVDRQIVFYGGIPTPDQLAQRVRNLRERTELV